MTAPASINFVDKSSYWDTIGGCDNKTISYHCTASYSLKIEKALYGRFDSTTCYCEKCWENGKDNGRCDNAKNCGAFDGTEILKAKCEGKTSCEFMADEIWDGQVDPCPGRAKYAMIKGKCEMTISQTGDISVDYDNNNSI